MATHKSGKGQRGDHRKRDAWAGSRDYKSGSSSPGPKRNQWHGNYRSDSPRDYREHHSQRQYVQYLLEEWKKIECKLQKEPAKDTKITHLVEYVEKNPSNIKVEDLFDVQQYLRNRHVEKSD